LTGREGGLQPAPAVWYNLGTRMVSLRNKGTEVSVRLGQGVLHAVGTRAGGAREQGHLEGGMKASRQEPEGKGRPELWAQVWSLSSKQAPGRGDIRVAVLFSRGGTGHLQGLSYHNF
jgi:hypothetical protein